MHRGAASRPRPLAALGRIAEYYAVTLRSDRGYVGVLAYNPIHSDYATVYPRAEPYDLAELALERSGFPPPSGGFTPSRCGSIFAPPFSPHPSSASDSTNRTRSACRERECFW